MRALLPTCTLVAALASGCYAWHDGDVPDGGSVDADAPDAVAPRPDAACAESAPCDDGDPCTIDDRCRAGACAGTPRVCDSPPGACFAPIGACMGGECVYDPADGPCDDGDPCTDGDACTGGVCRGEPRVCDAPPPPTCVSASTLRTFEPIGTCAAGSCDYAHVDRECPDGCADGACRCVPTPWEVTIVDPMWGGGVYHDGLVIDESGGLHVVYGVRREPAPPPGEPRVTLHYAHLPPGGDWVLEPLWPATGQVSIGVDPRGGVHLVYRDADTRAVLHWEREPDGTWTSTTIDVEASSEAVMTVDPTGVVHVVYETAEQTMYAARAPDGTWTTEVVPPGVAELEGPSAAVADASGALHVAHGDWRGWAGYAHRDPSGTWTYPTLYVFVGSGVPMDIAVDERGVHMLARSDGSLIYAHRSGGTWSYENVTSEWD
ncbi:MAG TPA: hypothetical protein VIL20_01955, partial [Sandaracinaceae bacterium]